MDFVVQLQCEVDVLVGVDGVYFVMEYYGLQLVVVGVDLGFYFLYVLQYDLCVWCGDGVGIGNGVIGEDWFGGLFGYG